MAGEGSGGGLGGVVLDGHEFGDARTQTLLQALVAAGGGIPTAADQALAPKGSWETASRRNMAFNPATTPASGTLYLVALYLPKNTVISNFTFYGCNQAAVSPTHWWYGLYDQNLAQLAVTADQLTAGYGTFTAHTLPIAQTAAGAATSFTTTYSGLYYIGWMMTATTVANNYGGASGGTPSTAPPILAGTSDTGQTVPPAFPHTAAAITADVGKSMYAFVT